MAVNERQYDRERKAAKRKAGREVELLLPKDLGRRRACLEDPLEFMRRYFGWIFWQPFTTARERMVESIIHAARFSGDFAVADKRGGGKSAIALFATFWLDLRDEITLPLIIGKNQTGAENELSNLKQAMVESPDFADDFPEICLPIIELEDWASAARKQTVNGHHTKIGLAKDCIFLPTIPQSALPAKWPADVLSVARGQGIAVVGIDGKIRGFKRRNTRPGMAIIDDIDDRESARSLPQTADKRDGIDKDTIGLAGSGKRTSRVMLCTTINDRCVAAIYTAMSSWHGQRFKAISKMPAREDLRDQYIEMRDGRKADDPDAREANAFYLENQEEIERDGTVDNENDFVGTPGPDGSPLEVSAFQHYFNLIADTNWESFLCEYQNEPPASQQIATIGLTKELIRKRLSGFDHGVLPPDCKITIGIDIGKVRCYWVAVAMRRGGVASVLHYGSFKVHDTEDADDKTKQGQNLIDEAILDALIEWREQLISNPFKDTDGNAVEPSLVLIDSGYHDNPVVEFSRRYGGTYRPTKGFGDNHNPGAPSPGKKIVGNQWSAKLQSGNWWLWIPNTDHWKRAVHEGFMTEPLGEDGRPRKGSVTLYNTSDRNHHREYANHIMAEKWEVEFIPGKGDKPRWNKLSAHNHLLDATALCLCAGEMLGLGVFAPEPNNERRPAVISAGVSSQARW